MLLETNFMENLNLQEQMEEEHDTAVKRGEIIYQDECSDERWEELVRLSQIHPQHYIEMGDCIQIVPELEGNQE